ncbi:hypothetical protein HK414_13725 [Ramlibacter terrae]|uniref:Uncharacterized protein n=1 Tax=Ramlibacter terrae TaxID=2732511 RepID=A0ABX6P2Y2_9BURK|nr:hypothetical protein HK414_13725 [Ramlibacter terrae]
MLPAPSRDGALGLADGRRLPAGRASELAAALERLPANALAIVTDGVEFFHANKQAVDGFTSQCEKRGLMAQRGEHWQLRWRAAVTYAVRLFLGRRKAARARAAAPSQRVAAPVRNAPAS